MFSVECRQIQDITSNITLIPPGNVNYSTALSGYRNISNVWCAHVPDTSPYVNLTFTEPVYLLSAVLRGRLNIYNNYVTNFSVIYGSPSGENVTYMNVNGSSVRCFITFISYMCMIIYLIVFWAQ